MKKILTLVIVIAAFAANAKALNPADFNAFYKLNDKTAFTTLVGYIDADQEQANFLKHVFQVTASELKRAEETNNELAIDNVVNYNLKNTKVILEDEQYRKYLSFINRYLKTENGLASVSISK